MKKTETKSTVLLQHHLKALKLPTIQRECEKTAVLSLSIPWRADVARTTPTISPRRGRRE